MWLLYSIIHVFLLAVVNYIDEHLTTNSRVSKEANIHKKIGGLLLVSTIFSCLGAFTIYLLYRNIFISPQSMLLAIFSAVPIVIMYASYFYLLTTYPAYQVVPLFLLSSLWLLLIEIAFGGVVSFVALLGIVLLVTGAYFLDAGTLKWQIPTKLLLIMIPATSMWSIALFMVRIATNTSPAVTVSFWQLVAVSTIGVILFMIVRQYREGFLFRLKHQGKSFIGFSLINESLAQTSYVFGNLAVAIAPVASFIPAMSGLQSIFLLMIFAIFPIEKERSKITKLQFISIIMIALGVYLIERTS